MSSVFKIRNERFVGLFQIQGDEIKKGINLTNAEWLELISRFPEIKYLLKGGEEKEVVIECLDVFKVNYYLDDNYYNIDNCYKGISMRDKTYLSGAAARADAEKYKDILQKTLYRPIGKISYEVINSLVDLPLPTNLMQLLYYYLVHKQVNGFWDTHSVQVAMKRIGEHHLKILFDKALERISSSPISSIQYASCAKAFISCTDILYIKENKDSMFQSHEIYLTKLTVYSSELPEIFA